MGWTSRPDRREITLLLCCLTVYLISYNIDSSLKLLGLNPSSTQGLVLTRLGIAGTNYIDADGRKPEGWRDIWEDETYGTWAWDSGHMAGDGLERSQPKGSTRHGAMWMSKADVAVLSLNKTLGATTVDRAVLWWENNLPSTKLLKHVPGYTILDNVFIFNKTTYIVAENRSSFPDLSSIVAAPRSDYNRWQIVTLEEGRSILGVFGGLIRDVTWMSTDQMPHNSTLFALWRTYSSLDQSIDTTGQTILPAPVRLVYPNVRFFTDANPPFGEYLKRRSRADTGFHPYLAKAAFPRLTALYTEDWEDYHAMEVPFLIERLVVADRSAARNSLHQNEPIFAPSMNLEASLHWWEPIRRSLASYYDLEEDEAPKHVVTYLHRQGEGNGPRLRSEDHDLLIRSLENMAAAKRYELNVVSTSTLETRWDVKMYAIARSTVVLGVHGNHLFDSMFMTRSPKSTLVELFPSATFVRDRELSARSIGLRYIALCGDQKHTSDALPPLSPPRGSQVISIDAEAVVEAIQTTLSRY